jgi:hypothetical protein
MTETLLQVLSHPWQLLAGALVLQFAIEQLLLGGLQISGSLIEGLTHVLAEGGQGLMEQLIEGRVSGGVAIRAIAGLAEHQQGQFTGNGAALHQALLEGMGV